MREWLGGNLFMSNSDKKFSDFQIRLEDDYKANGSKNNSHYALYLEKMVFDLSHFQSPLDKPALSHNDSDLSINVLCYDIDNECYDIGFFNYKINKWISIYELSYPGDGFVLDETNFRWINFPDVNFLK